MKQGPPIHLEYPHPVGEISEVQIGTIYSSREEVRLAKLHRPPMAGISYITNGPAESIVISGGYEDDEDFGDTIIYTGQGGQDSPGGKQVKDQEITRGNRALIFSEEHESPIRIIRGSGGDPQFSPKSGYRYDGLYLVMNHWFEKSKNGPLVIRFELNQILELAQINPSVQPVGAAPSGNAQPERKSVTTSSIKRDSSVSDWVKKVHGDRCQFCGITLITRVGTYSTGAHIQGLGRPHHGKDETSNLLCLCPNCHVLFDRGVLYIAPDIKTVINIVNGEKSALHLDEAHHLDEAAIAHHRLQVAGIKDWEGTTRPGETS
jgi:putative restriction endonuclease